MSVFQHPHLSRGIVKTPSGAFVISRGLVEMPDEVGESLGWRAIDREDAVDAAQVRAGIATLHLAGVLSRQNWMSTAFTVGSVVLADKTLIAPSDRGKVEC